MGLAPHKVKTLLFVSFDAPNHFEDISGSMDKKLEALRAHTSQVGQDALLRIKKRGRMLGKKAGMRYAEGFKKIELA